MDNYKHFNAVGRLTKTRNLRIATKPLNGFMVLTPHDSDNTFRSHDHVRCPLTDIDFVIGKKKRGKLYDFMTEENTAPKNDEGEFFKYRAFRVLTSVAGACREVKRAFDVGEFCPIVFNVQVPRGTFYYKNEGETRVYLACSVKVIGITT